MCWAAVPNMVNTYSDDNMDKFIAFVSDRYFNQYKDLSPARALDLFNAALLEMYNRSSPVKVKTVSIQSRKHQWITPELNKLINKKTLAFTAIQQRPYPSQSLLHSGIY